MSNEDQFVKAGYKPTSNEYLSVSENALLARLNNSQNQSEAVFMQAVIAIRSARDQRESNENLVRETKALVNVTWVLCAVTALAYLVLPFLTSLLAKCPKP